MDKALEEEAEALGSDGEALASVGGPAAETARLAAAHTRAAHEWRAFMLFALLLAPAERRRLEAVEWLCAHWLRPERLLPPEDALRSQWAVVEQHYGPDHLSLHPLRDAVNGLPPREKRAIRARLAPLETCFWAPDRATLLEWHAEADAALRDAVRVLKCGIADRADADAADQRAARLQRFAGGAGLALSDTPASLGRQREFVECVVHPVAWERTLATFYAERGNAASRDSVQLRNAVEEFDSLCTARLQPAGGDQLTIRPLAGWSTTDLMTLSADLGHEIRGGGNGGGRDAAPFEAVQRAAQWELLAREHLPRNEEPL